MKNKILILKKTILSMILLLCMAGLAGCGGNLANFVETDLSGALTERVTQNQDVLKDMYEAGLLDKKIFDEYNDNMVQLLEAYRTELVTLAQKAKDGDTSASSQVIHSISRLIELQKTTSGMPDTVFVVDKNRYYALKSGVKDASGNTVSVISDSDFNSIILSNFIIGNSYYNSSFKSVGSSNPSYENTNPTPLPLVGSKIIDSMNERFAYPVYVLNPDVVTSDCNNSLDEVVMKIKKALTLDADSEGNNNMNMDLLNGLFIDSGYKLADSIDIELIRDTSDWGTSFSDDGNNNEGGLWGLGKDVLIKQYGKNILTLRLTEFNPESVDILYKIIGLNSNKYIVANEKIFVMEYPVWYLYSIQNKTEGGDDVIGTFEEAGIGVNVYTQKIIKYDPLYDDNKFTGWSKSGTEIPESVNQYLTVAGATSNTEDGKSAFIINGKQPIEVNITLNTKSGEQNTSKTVQGARIILRDYLEATYAPGLVDESSLVVFGRKIRLLMKPDSFNSDGTINFNKVDNVAIYVDKNGNNIYDGNYLKITDFCSAINLTNATPNVRSLTLKGETKSVTIDAQDIMDGTLPTIEQIAQNRIAVTGTVKLTEMFPGNYVGKADYGDKGTNDHNGKQRFYIIATKKGIFNSGLYSNWINISNPDASLDWWNKYLGDNSFVYSVGHQKVNDYLLGNFQYELSQSGVIILDLNVVAFIQEEMNERNKTGAAEFTRTIFVIFGWFLICYASLLVIAWVMDTNLDMGLDILTKMSFGHWIAVKYVEDIPKNDISNNKYMPLSGVVWSSLIITLIGLLLITLDVYAIVIFLTRTIGKVASQIQKLMNN